MAIDTLGVGTHSESIKAGLMLFTVLTSVHTYTKYTLYIVCYTATILFYICVKTVFAALKKRKDAAAMLLVVAAIIAGVTADTFDTAVFYGSCSTFAMSTLAVVAIQACIMARWYSRALREAMEYSEKMEHLNSLKDDFLANASHMFSMPINGMNAVIESVVRDKERELDRSGLESALVMSKRLQDQISELLDFSKMERKKQGPGKDAFEIEPLIDILLSELKGKLDEKGTVVVRKYDGDRPLWLSADKYRVAQIIYSLIDSALEVSGQGSRLSISVMRRHNMFFFCVSGESGRSIKSAAEKNHAGRQKTRPGEDTYDWVRQEMEMSIGTARALCAYL